ncbi:MAG: flagellar M-ring protein FliF [Nitrospirae bacterium]|nr:flagellar M-ring protein FliF [Nitrospirota bacterium]
MPNVLEIVKGWSKRTKVIVISTIIVVISSLILLFSWTQKTDYQVLFSNLTESDAGAIVNKLNEMKVPFKLTVNSILVPAPKVYELRLQLAAQGLPVGGGIGFEIFDKTDFQTTDFVQKLNYKRALEGELSRTISSLSEIDHTRVHLALPEKSLFVKDKETATASILVKLKPGRSLSQSQVQGIVHLVSSSIEGLNPGDITIVDNNGTMLTRPSDDVLGLTTTQLEYQKKYEQQVETTIKDILEPVIGKDRVKVKVSADLDFSRTEKTEEKFDPEGSVLRSEQSMKEKSQSGSPGGVPGVQSNLPGKPGTQAQGQQTQSQKESDTTNFEITKVTSHTLMSLGNLRKLSAAVLVDGMYKEKKGSKELTYVPRTDDEIKRYDDLVKKAIGYTQTRGDEVSVVNMPFEPVAKEEIAPERRDWLKDAAMVAKYFAPLIVAILFYFFIVRPVIKSLSQESVQTQIPVLPLPASSAEISKEMKPELPEARTREVPLPPVEELALKSEITDWSQWVKDNPSQAATLIKEWVQTEEAEASS